MITLYSANTPNGIKIAIALEEIGVEYQLIPVNLAAGDQKKTGFSVAQPEWTHPGVGRSGGA